MMSIIAVILYRNCPLAATAGEQGNSEYCRNNVKMKRFLIDAPEMVQNEQELWRQAGFDFVTSAETSATDAGVGIDVWARGNGCPLSTLLDFQALRVLVVQLRPKVVILKCSPSCIPPEFLQTAYSVRTASAATCDWLLATKLEAPLSEDMGALLSEQATAAFAESLYYYLLRDVFRETAEWCGHMSSVVGRM
jgi:hypothetical protein